jgi:hypothetical protein
MKKKMRRFPYASKVENCWIMPFFAQIWRFHLENGNFQPWLLEEVEKTTEALSSSIVQTKGIVGIQLFIRQDSLNQ